MEPFITIPVAIGLGLGIASLIKWWRRRRQQDQDPYGGDGSGGGNGSDQGSGGQQQDRQSPYRDDFDYDYAEEARRQREAEERTRIARNEQRVREALEAPDEAVSQQLLNMAGMAHLPLQQVRDDPAAIRRLAEQLDELQLQILSVAAKPQSLFDDIDLATRAEREPVGYPTDDIEIERVDDPEDLTRLLPDEMALEDDLFLGMLAADDLHTAQPYETRTTRRRLYVAIDVSGSMAQAMYDGQPRIAWGAGVALQLLLRAARGEAQYLIRYFDGRPHGLRKIENPAEAQQFINELVRIQANGGGTDIAAALRQAAADVRGASRADIKTSDILLISDGESDLEVAWLRKLLGSDLRLHVAIIGNRSPQLQAVATSYREYS